ncbi:hypothetical protein FQZ97_556660 [compost metagenome]
MIRIDEVDGLGVPVQQAHAGGHGEGGEAFPAFHVAHREHRGPGLQQGQVVFRAEDGAGNAQRGDGAHAFRAFQGDLAAHQLRQPARDRQPQSGAAETPGGTAFALHEGREQVLDVIPGDADAGVLDTDHYHRGLAVHRLDAGMQPDAAVAGELDGVAEEVEQDLPDADAIGMHRRRHPGIHAQAQLQALFMGLRQQQAQHAVDQFAQVQRFRGDAQPAGFDLRVVEDVVENLRERLSGLLGEGEQPPLFVAQLGGLQDLHQAQHAVHRRADLVAHHRQETFLRPQSRLGDFLGLAQRFLLAMAVGHIRDHAIPHLQLAILLRHGAQVYPAAAEFIDQFQLQVDRGGKAITLVEFLLQSPGIGLTEYLRAPFPAAVDEGPVDFLAPGYVAGDVADLPLLVSLTAPKLEDHRRETPGDVLQLLLGAQGPLARLVNLGDVLIHGDNAADGAIGQGIGNRPGDDRALLALCIQQRHRRMPDLHGFQRLLLQFPQYLDRAGRLLQRQIRLAQVIGLPHPEELLEGRVHLDVAMLRILGHDGLRQACQQRFLQGEFAGQAILDLAPAADLVVQAEVGDHQQQDHQGGQCEHYPVAGQQHRPGRVELVFDRGPALADPVAFRGGHRRQGALQDMAQRGLPGRQPQAEVLVESRGSGDPHVLASLAAHQRIQGQQVADHGVCGVVAQQFEAALEVVNFRHPGVRQLFMERAGDGAGGDDRYLPAAQGFEPGGVGRARGGDDRRRDGGIDTGGYQRGVIDRLAHGARDQVDLAPGKPSQGIFRTIAGNMDEFDVQQLAQVVEVVDRQPAEPALRVLRGEGELQRRGRVADGPVGGKQDLLGREQDKLLRAAGLDAAQPFVAQVLHGDIGEEGQPPVQFAHHFGGLQRRAETIGRVAHVQAAQAGQVLVVLLGQHPGDQNRRADIDVAVAVPQGAHGVVGRTHAEQARLRILQAQLGGPGRAGLDDDLRVAQEAGVERSFVAAPGNEHRPALEIARRIDQAIGKFRQRYGAENEIHVATARRAHRVVTGCVPVQFESAIRRQQHVQQLAAEAGQLPVLHGFKRRVGANHGNAQSLRQSEIGEVLLPFAGLCLRQGRYARGHEQTYRSQEEAHPAA